MMTHVASVNGKNIYSDKSITGISNSRVMFTDGSWCDVSTGDVHNAGPGYLRIGSDDTSSSKITKGPVQVKASSLTVRDIGADVNVWVHESVGIEYTITGPSDLVEAIRFDTRQNDLEITGEASSSGHSGSFMQVGGINIGGHVSVFSGVSSITIGGIGSEPSEVQVTIKVPRGTAVAILNVNGSVNIGDTDGALAVQVLGPGDFHAGRVRDTDITIQGSGHVTVDRIDGEATASVVGSGDIEILDGIIKTLKATVTGSGDISFDGTATKASLVITGSGDIRVARITNEPIKRVAGSGTIRVRHIG